MPRLLLLVLALAAVLAVGTARGDDITRREVIAIAHAYVHVVWVPTSKNVFHGNDPDGVRVDTPDLITDASGVPAGWWVVGQKNVGMPYMWGGFSSLEDFTTGVRAGKYAGDMYSDDKRQRLDGAVSKYAVGIDCSGFISRCWKLDRSYSTRELPDLCDALASWDDLKPGDILNLYNDHVLMFRAWKDDKHTRFYSYNAGSPPVGKLLLIDTPVAFLVKLGYKPYRYKHIQD